VKEAKMKKAFALACLIAAAPASAEETARALPAPQQDVPAGEGSQTAVFAGGCFWGIQGVFQHVKGVTATTAGYAGGAAKDARYDVVGTETTGHAEAVRIVFDPHQVSYGRLLQVFFSVMDPTTLNAQGPDSGPSYRSEVFAADPAQERVAKAYIAQLAGGFSHPIVTRVSLGKTFYAAEGYHQDYLVRHPGEPYIVWNDLPKLDTLKRLYPGLYRGDPVLARR
jgi:peptide-methionine (S)-S-oxide reductase